MTSLVWLLNKNLYDLNKIIKRNIFLGFAQRFGREAGLGIGDWRGSPVPGKLEAGKRQVQNSQRNQVKRNWVVLMGNGHYYKFHNVKIQKEHQKNCNQSLHRKSPLKWSLCQKSKHEKLPMAFFPYEIRLKKRHR